LNDAVTEALTEFTHSPIEVIAALVVVAGAVSTAFEAGRRFWVNVWSRVRRKPLVPRETLRIVQDTRSSFWGPATIGDVPAMQVVLDGYVTDISGKPNRVLRVEIPKPLTDAAMLLSNNHDARRPQILSANECAEFRVCFFVQPVVAKKGKPWESKVIFIDQYGNRHKVGKCVFRPIVIDRPPQPKEPEEYPYEIADPIEKEVVAVLKAELNRYEVCDRRFGGLGSIHIVYQGHPFTGVGGDAWNPNSPLNQVIVSDPEAASLMSDNLDALMALYRGLESDEEKGRFVKALLDRLDARRGYLAVSYFMVAVLWRVGSFADALRKAREALPENETRVFGLSNVLMLLNGLLKYRYPEFTNEMLDEIERMTHGLKEPVFRIPAKIAAVRTSRLSGSAKIGFMEDYQIK
jgi:hypothetical protein